MRTHDVYMVRVPEGPGKRLNLRRDEDRLELLSKGWTWVTAICRGDAIGTVYSKHRSRQAAERRARWLDLDVCDLRDPRW